MDSDYRPSAGNELTLPPFCWKRTPACVPSVRNWLRPTDDLQPEMDSDYRTSTGNGLQLVPDFGRKWTPSTDFQPEMDSDYRLTGSGLRLSKQSSLLPQIVLRPVVGKIVLRGPSPMMLHHFSGNHHRKKSYKKKPVKFFGKKTFLYIF